MNVLLTKGQKHMKEALKYLQAGAIVPVDMETTILLVNALKEALAQPAQEPVAWMFQSGDKFGWRDEIQFVKPWANFPVFRNIVALYTAPPQRTWVGLTDEDMKDPKTHNFDFIYGARWAEAKLKEKNA
jgi:hypothetical protein